MKINDFEKELFADFLEGKINDGQYEVIGNELDMLKKKYPEEAIKELKAMKVVYEVMVNNAFKEENMEIKIEYIDEKNFHIDYGSITQAIAKHLLNSKTLKEIANKER